MEMVCNRPSCGDPQCGCEDVWQSRRIIRLRSFPFIGAEEIEIRQKKLIPHNLFSWLETKPHHSFKEKLLNMCAPCVFFPFLKSKTALGLDNSVRGGDRYMGAPGYVSSHNVDGQEKMINAAERGIRDNFIFYRQ